MMLALLLLLIPGAPPEANFIKVTTHVTVMREWRGASFVPNGSATINAPGSFERVQVHSPWGGLICTQQNSPPPLTLVFADPGVVYTGCATYEFESSQITLINPREYQGPELEVAVDIQKQFHTIFHSGAVLMQEFVTVTPTVTVQYL